MNVEASFGLLPPPEMSYSDPALIEALMRGAEGVRAALGNGLLTCSFDPARPADGITTTVRTAASYPGMYDAFARAAGATFAATAIARLPNDPLAVVRARWVELRIDTEAIDYDYRRGAINAYPVGCSTCGGLDVDSPPDPYQVWGRVVGSPKNLKKDAFKGANGVLVVDQRVLEILQRHVGDQIAVGAVAADGGGRGRRLSWVRPLNHIGEYVQTFWEGPTCGACGRPQVVVRRDQPRGRVVRDFGDPKLDIALVGRWAAAAKPNRLSSVYPLHDIVVSGGLFAVLFNEGVRGLDWAWDGPFLSVNDAQSPLEEVRRFAEEHAGSKDKVLKYKPK